MSHVATVNLEVTDIKALQLACKELGLEFVEGAKTFAWFGRWVDDYSAKDAAYKNGIKPEEYGTCDHKIKVKGCTYEIGVKHVGDGKYVCYYDFFGPGKAIRNMLGQNLGKLKQFYGVNKVEMQAKSKGYKTTRVMPGKESKLGALMAKLGVKKPKAGHMKVVIEGAF
jgi:hypothetical protein